MKAVTLYKDGQKKDFTERAARIAVESFGWQEIVPLKVPSEIGTKTRPPEIKRPIEPAVKELNPVVEAKPYKVVETEKGVTIKPNTPAVKKTRKSPVRSKTSKK
jgi:hypothetical protein